MSYETLPPLFQHRDVVLEQFRTDSAAVCEDVLRVAEATPSLHKLLSTHEQGIDSLRDKYHLQKEQVIEATLATDKLQYTEGLRRGTVLPEQVTVTGMVYGGTVTQSYRRTQTDPSSAGADTIDVLFSVRGVVELQGMPHTVHIGAPSKAFERLRTVGLADWLLEQSD